MNISGKYNSNQGEMQLEQTDNIVTGSYSLNGIINGLIENNKLKAIWKNGTHEGLLELEFNEDNSFAGKYKKGKEDAKKKFSSLGYNNGQHFYRPFGFHSNTLP